MRLRPLFLAFACAALAWSAQAQIDPQTDSPTPPSDTQPVTPQDARDAFQAGLERQCPDKQLQLLSARNLSDALDSYKASVPNDVRLAMVTSETTHCSSLDDGAACVDIADIAAADDVGRMDELVTWVCTSFLRCHDQGVCDYAR